MHQDVHRGRSQGPDHPSGGGSVWHRAFRGGAGPGVYHGSLIFGGQNAGENVIDNAKLMLYASRPAPGSAARTAAGARPSAGPQ